MNSLQIMLNPITSILLPPSPPPPPLLLPLRLPSTLSLSSRRSILSPVLSLPSRSASSAEVDLFPSPSGVYSALPPPSPDLHKVAVLWDLDNKPPRGPPYSAALALRRLASLFGRVVDVSAYANRHAFVHLPAWVLAQRHDRRRLDALERRGLTVSPSPYACGVCGRKFPTNLDLKKHFRQLHERERQKKIARMRSLKGKKRQKYRERFISNNHKYNEAARELLTPKTGYGLASELRRAGVHVKTVEDKPQAADSALKKQMQHSMQRGIDWLVLVSDDSDFTDMVTRAREAQLRTVVVGDGKTALGRHADLWVPWMRVENGEVGEAELMSFRNVGNVGGYEEEEEGGFFERASFYEVGGDVDDDEVVVRSYGFGGGRASAFSEEEVNVGDVEVEVEVQSDVLRLFGLSARHGTELFWDGEEEEDDGYI